MASRWEVEIPVDLELLEVALGRAVPLDKVTRISEKTLKGIGFLSKLHWLILEDNQGEVIGQVVIKLPPADPDAKGFVDGAGLHLAEREFYCHAGDLKLPLGLCLLPTCYYPLPGDLAQSEPEKPQKGREDLLMVSFCKGSVPDFFEGLSPKQTEASLSALAELHATLWTPGGGNGPVWLADAESTGARNEALFDGCLTPAVRAQLGKILRSKMGEEEVVKLEEGLLSSKLQNTIQSSIGSHYQGPKSIVHGDLWSGNTLLIEEKTEGEEKTKVVFIDWQFSTFSNPIIDVAILVTSSTPPSLWLGHEEEILTPYYTSLQKALKLNNPDHQESWTLSDCVKAFRSALPYSFLMLAASILAWLPEDKPPRPLVVERYVGLARELVKNGE